MAYFVQLRAAMFGLVAVALFSTAFRAGQLVERVGWQERALMQEHDKLEQVRMAAQAERSQRERVADAVAQGHHAAAGRDKTIEELQRYVPTSTDDCKAAIDLLAQYRANRLLNNAAGRANSAVPAPRSDSAAAAARRESVVTPTFNY